MQLELFQSPRAIQIRRLAEDVWRSRWFGWCAITFFALWYLWWGYHIPSPAKAATVLAVVAGIMSYRSDPEGFEKLFWTVILFAFLFMELKAIDHKDQTDEIAHREQRATEQANFQSIADGITGVIKQSDQQFKAIVGQQSQDFDKTMKETQAGIDSITGGSSYVVVYPSFAGKIAGNVFPLAIRLCTRCSYSIAHAEVHMQLNGEETSIYSGPVDRDYAIRTDATIVCMRDKENLFKILVFARNKPTFEDLKVRFNNQFNDWEFSLRVAREEKHAHFNPKTKMAEGQVLRVLEDSPWQSNGMVPTNPTKVKITH